MPAQILFDLDGTLTDPAPGIVASYRHALTLVEHDPGAGTLRGLVGKPPKRALASLLGDGDDALLARALGHYREHFALQGALDTRPYPGIPEALAKLHASGARMAVATSTPQLLAERVIDACKLRAYLPRVFGTPPGAPRADKLAAIARALTSENLAGSPAEPAFMIGDRQHDLHAARKHGMRAIGVLWGYGTPQELAAAKPDCLVIDPTDLPEVVETLLA